MSLFKKKEEIPTIPTAASLPSLPSLPPLPPKEEELSKKTLSELPSFPPNTKNENLNREMVKSAISDEPSLGEEEIQVNIPKNLRLTEELKEESPIPPLPPIQNPIPELPKSTNPKKPQIELQKPNHLALPTQPSKQNEPIFVRIDKFQTAQKNFEEIKTKLTEIESTLQKIKNVKIQEEKELKDWTEETEKLKSRLAEIDSEIFSQL